LHQQFPAAPQTGHHGADRRIDEFLKVNNPVN
jgi:hypothetical protein